ncbi:MAG TPA: PilZ domain-containing protein [Terriglobales bacterium]|nr:PilZ domain-containing protein [Terriglobales bacterium]
MPESPKDRRTAPRFAMRLPLIARFSNGSVHEEETFTQDVSSSGAFFYVDMEIGGLRQIELTLILPAEGETPADIRVRYTGRVARLERSPEGRLGVAAAFGSCEYLAQA